LRTPVQYSGKPDGGYQARGNENPNFHWDSCNKQTWSATAYLNMIYYDLAGIRINEKCMAFKPFLPEKIHYLRLNNITYHQAKLIQQ